MILHAFPSNDKTKEGIDRIQPDLNSAIADINEYIGITTSQLSYLFRDAFKLLNEKTTEIAETWKCPPGTPPNDCPGMLL